MKPVIYNREVERQGVLRRAHHIGYERVFNDLHTASFDLPVPDADVALCENTHYIVDIYDGDRYIDKFRITGQPQECVTEAGAVYRYACDHVIAFLADCRIDGYLEVGGTGVSTRQVIETLLARQQDEWGFARWRLGRCDFDFYFQYAFENTDVLNALYAVPKCFLDSYHFTFDTTAYPWTVNLIRGTEEANCAIQYRRNLQWIKRTKDVTSLCTRLYCLGSGEGVNQTNIKRLTGGVNYIESQTRSKHGIIAKHLIDRSISDDELLYAKGRALLAEIDEPMYSYVVGGLDLHRKTGLDFDLMDEGRVVRVQDEEAGIDFTKPILSVRKDDVELDPLGIEITVANRTEDIASTIENLSARAAITAQYSQGATNLFPMQVTDNADPGHPAVFKFFVPESCAKINAVKLSWQMSAFRAYETGAEAGGGISSTTLEGGASVKTTTSGGSVTKTIPQRVVSITKWTGGPLDVETYQSVTHTGYPVDPDALNTIIVETDAATGNTGTSAEQNTGVSRNADGAMLSTGSGGSGSTGSASGNTGTPIGTASGAAMTETGTGGPTTTGSTSASVTVDTYTAYTSSSSPGTDSAGTHSHTVKSHTHSISGHRHTLGTDASYTGYYYLNDTGGSSPGTGSNGSHSHTVNSHSHEMTHKHTASGGSHTHSVDQHSHGMNHYHAIGSHTHSMPEHSHSMSHWHTIDGHRHSLGNHTHKFSHRHNMQHYHDLSHSHTIGSFEIDIPGHTHEVSIPAHEHSFTLLNHTHDIVYGIYEGGIASGVSISVDGNAIPADKLLDENGYPVAELDVVGYMATDGDGRITRGTWHEVLLTPDSLTRIEAFLFVQTFVRSYSGGEY